MSKDTFKGRYQVSDGYAGRARPQYFQVNAEELRDDMTDDELEDMYDELMLQAFEERIHPEGENHEEFIAWAKGKLAQRSSGE